MTASVGMYTQLVHDRPEDHRLMTDGMVSTVLLMEPGFSNIMRVWNNIKDRRSPKIILRMWAWDDGRTKQNPSGVYGELREDPQQAAKKIMDNWSLFYDNFLNWCSNEGVEPPPLENLVFHLVNEPDTNDLMEQIDIYTETAVDIGTARNMRLLCYNFGTGHPAELLRGEPNWTPLTRSIDAIRSAGSHFHIVGLHEYYNDRGLFDLTIKPWHIGRHNFKSCRLALKGIYKIISEHGLEMLVNDRASDHHGYVNVISGEQFCNNIVKYCTEITTADEVLIYASDLIDPVWKTFDPYYAIFPAVNTFSYINSSPFDDNGDGSEDGNGEEPDPKPDLDIIWPTDGQMTQRFGENEEYYREKLGIKAHNGIDIANKLGTPIYAIADGVVDWNAWDENYGWYVRMYHDGFHSFYAHMSEQSQVKGGSVLKKGDVVGMMGTTGLSTGSHLHFEIRIGERYGYKNVHEGYRNGRCNPETFYAARGLYW